MFMFHDDWGSQRETFFAPDVAEEMLVPHIRRLTDFVHSKGRFCDMHSCGQNLKQVPNMIKCGFDSWSGQPMNDTAKEYELYGDKILIGVIPRLSMQPRRGRAACSGERICRQICRPDKLRY
jgi:uroporphyrinogen-III decarboxylase